MNYTVNLIAEGGSQGSEIGGQKSEGQRSEDAPEMIYSVARGQYHHAVAGGSWIYN